LGEGGQIKETEVDDEGEQEKSFPWCAPTGKKNTRRSKNKDSTSHRTQSQGKITWHGKGRDNRPRRGAFFISAQPDTRGCGKGEKKQTGGNLKRKDRSRTGENERSVLNRFGYEGGEARGKVGGLQPETNEGEEGFRRVVRPKVKSEVGRESISEVEA